MTMKERPIRVTITDTTTGESRTFDDTGTWGNEYGDTGFQDYIWSEGNYGCDCNREIFFRRVKDEDDSQRKCGEGRFTLRIVDPATGEELYADAAVR